MRNTVHSRINFERDCTCIEVLGTINSNFSSRTQQVLYLGQHL